MINNHLKKTNKPINKIKAKAKNQIYFGLGFVLFLAMCLVGPLTMTNCPDNSGDPEDGSSSDGVTVLSSTSNAGSQSSSDSSVSSSVSNDGSQSSAVASSSSAIIISTNFNGFGGNTSFPDATHSNGSKIFPDGSYDPATGELVGVIFDFEDIHAITNAGSGWILEGGFDPTNIATFNTMDGGVAVREFLRGRTDRARIGNYRISTCEGLSPGLNACDSTTGTLTSAAFTISNQYINFLMTGCIDRGPRDAINGNTPSQTLEIEMRLFTNGAATDNAANAIYRFNPYRCVENLLDSPDGWYSVDIGVYSNRDLRLQLTDQSSEGCGFLTFDHLYQSEIPGGTVQEVLE